MRNRKALKHFYFRQKFKVDKSHLWKSMLPAVPFDFITSDPWYQQNREKFLTCGPRVWLLKLIHEKGPLRVDAIWDIYNRDENLTKQEFFESQLKRSYRFKQEFFEDYAQGKIDICGSFQITQFQRFYSK